MPLYRVDVANIFYVTLPAETAEEACRLAKHRIDDQRGHDQRILKVEEVKEDES